MGEWFFCATNGNCEGTHAIPGQVLHPNFHLILSNQVNTLCNTILIIIVVVLIQATRKNTSILVAFRSSKTSLLNCPMINCYFWHMQDEKKLTSHSVDNLGVGSSWGGGDFKGLPYSPTFNKQPACLLAVA